MKSIHHRRKQNKMTCLYGRQKSEMKVAFNKDVIENNRLRE